MSKPVPQPATDLASLTTRMAKGEEEAFYAFHAAYAARLWRYLLVVARGREDLAGEALQLTLVRVARHVHRIDNEPAFWSWLTVLARSALVDEARKSQRHANLLEQLSQTQAAGDSARDHQAERPWLTWLEESLDLLDPEDRALVERKYFADASVKEIAAELHATDKAVESRLVRARRKIKDLMLCRLRDENR